MYAGPSHHHPPLPCTITLHSLTPSSSTPSHHRPPHCHPPLPHYFTLHSITPSLPHNFTPPFPHTVTLHSFTLSPYTPSHRHPPLPHSRLFIDEAKLTDEARKHLCLGGEGGVRVYSYSAVTSNIGDILRESEGKIWVSSLSHHFQ